MAGESSAVVDGAVAGGWASVCVRAEGVRCPVAPGFVDSGVAGASSSPPVRSRLAPKPTRPSSTTVAAAVDRSGDGGAAESGR